MTGSWYPILPVVIIAILVVYPALYKSFGPVGLPKELALIVP
jgi:hypothetical protein